VTGGGKNIKNSCDVCGYEFVSLYTVEYKVNCADGEITVPSQMCKQCVNKSEEIWNEATAERLELE
jgi:hypothetical protein